MIKPTIAFIGAGAVGTCLAYWLKQAAYPLAGIASRSYASAQQAVECLEIPILSIENACRAADILFITTPDREIASVITHLSNTQSLHKGMIVAHTSGAHAADLLAIAHNYGAHIMSFHPLQSFTKPGEKLVSLKNCVFALEGDTYALAAGTQIAKELGGQPVIIQENQKALYHAGACAASNYFVSVLHLAISLLMTAGFSKAVAQSALLPLVHGTLKNIEENGVTEALTGPISRGDTTTVTAHIDAIGEFCPSLLPLYQQLGIYTTTIADQRASITANQAQILLKILSPNIIKDTPS